jgi:hypothetical protein
MTPPNIFEEGVGHFWGIHETRPYMRARYGLVESLLKIKTSLAVQAALDHALDSEFPVFQSIVSFFMRVGGGYVFSQE